MGKKHKYKHIIQRPHIKEPETEKEIIDRIRELEYAQISLDHRPNLRKVAYEDWLANEIKRLRVKLEVIQKPKQI